MEAKAQLVGLHDRVRSDAESGLPDTSAVKQNDSLSTTQGVKRVATATNPNAEDAAELLRYKRQFFNCISELGKLRLLMQST